jgi:Tfp pilus assembly protein PilF
MAERKFKEALVPLATAAELYPTYGEEDGPYLRMAAVQRELGDPHREREMLEKHVALDAEGIEPRLRLMELAAGAQDWPGVRKYADETLAVNPLIAPPHQYLAQAAEALGDRAVAIEARRTLLLLDPLDRAEQHYRVAALLAEDQQLAAAEKEAVMALEEAPRYRAAHRLLVEIVDRMDRSGEPRLSTPASRPTSAPGPEAKPEPKPAPALESPKPSVEAPAAPTPEPAR